MPWVESSTTTTFTEGIWSSLSTWADDEGAWQAYNYALAGMFEQVYSIVSDQGSPDEPAGYQAGWSSLLDPMLAPSWALPYTAAFVGVVIPPGTDASDAVALIEAEAGFKRGCPAAVIATAQRFLTGSQQITLLERTAADGSTPDAYHACLIVLTSQVTSATELQAAIDAVRPAGVPITLIQTSTWTIAQFEAAYSTVSAAEAAFPTISNLETDVP